MENIKLHISSIICFNSGSGGDLLKALCWSQLNIVTRDVRVNCDGAVDVPQYFKNITQEIYYKNYNSSDIEWKQVNSIENTHYYLDFYPDVADNIFFIDYPDHYVSKILDNVKKKRHNNNWDNFLTSNRIFLPEFARDSVTIDNVQSVFCKRWNKNLINWRSNTKMTAVNFFDFFNAEKMRTVVETIIKQPITSDIKYSAIYESWIATNTI